MATTADDLGRAPTNEIGHAGTILPPWNWWVDTTDEVPELQWPNNVWIYHRMRTDSQIDALWKSVTYPIRRFHWALDPNDADPQVVNELALDLGLPVIGQVKPPAGRRRQRFTHDDHLRQALLGLGYGHMFFEQNGVIDDHALWRLRKLAPRMPQSITAIQVAKDGGLQAIRQAGGQNTGTLGALGGVEIPVERLVAYVWDREGANWTGRSLFRSAYRHYLIKDRLIRVDALRHERFGLGVPRGKAPTGAGQKEVAAYGEMARGWRADRNTGAGLPEGADMELAGYTGRMFDVLKSVQYHDEAMARLFLAMFLQLGTTETGSRALGGTFTDFFDMSEHTIANWYATTFSEHVIEDWVDWNYGPDEGAPLLTWEKDDKDPISATDIYELVNAGALTLDPELEAWIRDRWGMPEKDATNPAGNATVAATMRKRQNANATARKRAAASSQTANDFRVGHRLPNAVEVQSAANFDVIQQTWQSQTASLVNSWSEIKAQQIAALTSAIETAVDAADLDALSALSAPVLGVEILTDHMITMAQTAGADAMREALAQGVTITTADFASLQTQLAGRAQAMAGLLARSIAQAAATQALQRYGVEALSGAQVASAVAEHLTSLSDSYLDDQLGGALTQAQNVGRMEVMGQAPGTYYASELLDQNTCENCTGVDARVYASIEDAQQDYPAGGYAECLGGARCRGTLVAVYDEAEPGLSE